MEIVKAKSFARAGLLGNPSDGYFGKTLSFARFLSENKKSMWVRQVLVPTYTDDEEDLKATRAFIDGLETVEKVEVLPYHTMGQVKYQKLGLSYPLDGLKTPDKASVGKAREILCRSGVDND